MSETITRNPATAEAINAITYGVPFTVYPDGTYEESTRFPYVECSAWEGCDFDLQAQGAWRPLTGLTGQYGYDGPCMHESEFIGEGIARLMREMAEEEPVTFMVVIVNWIPSEEEEAAGEEMDACGWAILHGSY